MDDDTLASFLVKYADDPAIPNKVLPILGSDPNTAARFLTEHTDEVVGLVARYGDDGFQALANYEDQAIDLFKEFGEQDLGPYLRSVIADTVVDLEKTHVTLTHGFEVQHLMQDVAQEMQEAPMNIHISGKWADTPDEKAIREAAAAKADNLFAGYLKNENLLPEDVWAVLQDVRQNPGKYGIDPDDLDALDKEIKEIKKFAAQREVAKEYTDLNWPQVKRSTGQPEVDVFIDIDDWKEINEDLQERIERELKRIFGLPDMLPDGRSTIDFYQKIDPPLWMEFLSDIDPRKTIPPGSISLLSGGTVVHQLLGGL